MALSESAKQAKFLGKSANETSRHAVFWQLGHIRASRLIAGETASLYSADVQIREPQMDGGSWHRASKSGVCEMSEKNEMISRRGAFSLLGLVAALGFALPLEVLTESYAEAQPAAPPAGQPAAAPEGGTKGSKRRKKRRTGRKERRKKRHGGGEATQQQK
jgi:hypothetical protein